MVQRYAQFHYSEKGLGLVSPPNFVYDLCEKCFSCYILLTDQISLPNCFYILRYWAICVLQLFVNLTFLIKPFRYMTKKSRQKRKYLENEKSF